MIEFLFECPDCKKMREVDERKKGITIITPVRVEDWSDGPGMFFTEGSEIVDDFDSTTEYVCSECGYKLPCSTPDEVIDLLVSQEIDRRY